MTKIKVSYSKIDYKEVEIQFPLYLYFQNEEDYIEIYIKITEDKIIHIENNGNIDSVYIHDYQILPSKYLSYHKINEEDFEKVRKELIEHINNL